MMTLFTILLIICSLVLIGLLYFDNPVHKKVKSDTSSSRNSRISPEEQATRELIGDRKYDEMKYHVSKLLNKHADDSFKTVMLTAGSIDRNALHILHSLLPGDTVRLQDNTRYGIPDVGVYVGEERIGRLLLDDATDALDAMTGHFVTGSYVAEQNSFGDESENISVKLIIFYTSAAIHEGPKDNPAKSPYKIIYRGLRPIVIYQN